MEGITEINKDDYIDNCLKIVKEMITEEDFSDEIWLALTFEEANIRNITNQYINNGGIKRFKKAHEVL